MKRIILLAAMSVFATGCSTYATDRYTISMDNVVALRSLNGQTINVGEFSASAPDKRSIVCRAVGPIKPPDGEPFSEYRSEERRVGKGAGGREGRERPGQGGG